MSDTTARANLLCFASTCELLTVLACGARVCRFRLAPRMGGPEQVRRNTALALTLKMEGGMWLTAEQRT